jgi:NAD(P)-dependent dehydrogenase (short-subunit alcohol dehydrogenase family)
MTDYESFKDRLAFEAIDLRFTNDVQAMCAKLLTKLPRLDILINNAAQTIRRPPQFYAHLLPLENSSTSNALLKSISTQERPQITASSKTDEKEFMTMEKELVTTGLLGLYGGGERVNGVGGLTAAEKTQLVLLPEDRKESNVGCFPAGQYDEHCQQVDLRKKNSWVLRPEEITPVEMGETQIVNAISPFLILQGLLPLLKHAAQNPIIKKNPTNDDDKRGIAHVVMVSAMEGVFNRHRKDTNHLHTNMAKAAMNMITRCCGEYYARDHNILVNSVDTGWIDDMTPIEMQQRDGKQEKKKRFVPPLNDVDGAARVLDPIFLAINQKTFHHGTFFKDYQPTAW